MEGREGGREGECGGILDRGHQVGVRIIIKLFVCCFFLLLSK